MSTSPSDALTLNAQYFDGRSAKARPVTLTLRGVTLVLRGESVAREDDIATLRVSEPMGAAPRLISYPDGAHCEVRDHAGLARMLRATGFRDDWVVRVQTRWRWALAAVAVTVAIVFAGYRWGLPAASEFIAFRMPDSVLAQLSGGTLEFLDKHLFKPSQLPEPRRKALADAFARMLTHDRSPLRYTLHFRDGVAVGANAMALPDGTIIITDQLVKIAAHDEEVLAVLAHELGHVSRRHGMRMLIQGSIVAFVVSWYIGDVSSIAAGLPTLLLQARYSREHELEADAFGAAMLTANGISPKRLADMLAKLEASHRAKVDESGKDKDHIPPQTESDKARRGSIGDYLASHPATRERIEALKKAQ
ncbi:MAG: M48 family metallopeptidase [Betaproteobacteria bacterium]|nr:M48 family metallopeptidase [Betaproteobacteria bacterium]